MNGIMVLFKLIQLSPWFKHHDYILYYEQSGPLRQNQTSAEGLLLKHRFAKTELFRSTFLNRTFALWNALPSPTRKTKTRAAFKVKTKAKCI